MGVLAAKATAATAAAATTMVAASGGDDGGFVCCPTVGVLCAVRVSSDPWAVFAASAAGGRAACGDAFIIFLRVFGASVASHESWYRVRMRETTETKAQLGLGQIGLLRIGDRHCTPSRC